jgi:type I restriction-modification system DNA methylase subunit
MNPYEREVHIERSINVQGRGKRADYAFFVVPDFQQTRWIAEAKKPMHNLENKDYCFQTLRYGWNSNTPLAILTDFDRFFILDLRYKPSIETAIDRIHKRFHYKDFADEEKFREIYYLFSREAVADGAIEKYAQSLKKGRGVRQTKLANTGIIQPVDDEFLSELDEQRGELARAFKNRNPQLDGEALTEITQRTLDRLVFIRFLEDKLVEPSEIIDKLGTRSNSAWQDFVAESRRLDKIYNGIIFKEHIILDAPGFAPDEKTFEDIRDWLSHKNSPYDFNTIPIHILGSAYERFLGKTIVATEKRAKVEEKPEVRKAGGVYYTPEYIVRYIVQNTIGKLIEGKTPEEIAEMRFADIACGSGSFLLGVFDYLIAYHVGYFDKNKNRRNNAIKNMQARETVDGTLQLTLGFKREILLANIYGVDLDAQAVEVAQLSLYLKLLEEETTDTAQQTFADFRTQLLPSLSNNIVHGNSLIDFDIMDGMLFDAKDLRKLNPLNFESTFPEIFRKGGFDAIVGNPPYGMISDETNKNYLERNFVTTEGRLDNYEVFIEKAAHLLNENTLLGYIIPSPILSNLYTKKLRNFILNENSLIEITNFNMDVFDDPTVHTCIIILNKNKENQEKIKIRNKVSTIEELQNAYDFEIDKNNFGNNKNSTFDIFINPQTHNLFEKLNKNALKLGEICFIRQCIKTGNNKEYVSISMTELEEPWKKSLRGKSIGRYSTVEKDVYLKYGNWLARNWKNKTFYETPKIAIRETGSRLTATLDLENRYFLSSLYAIYPKAKDESLNLSYILALLNSNLAM